MCIQQLNYTILHLDRVNCIFVVDWEMKEFIICEVLYLCFFIDYVHVHVHVLLITREVCYNYGIYYYSLPLMGINLNTLQISSCESSVP